MSFKHQHRTVHVISDKIRCILNTSTEQRMSYRTSYVVLQTPTQNNAYHIGQAAMSLRHQHSTMHVISDKTRCPSDTNTEQCMSYRQATISFRHQYRTMHIISYKLRCPSDTNSEQFMHIGQATMSFSDQHRTMFFKSNKQPCPSDTNTEQCL